MKKAVEIVVRKKRSVVKPRAALGDTPRGTGTPIRDLDNGVAGTPANGRARAVLNFKTKGAISL